MSLNLGSIFALLDEEKQKYLLSQVISPHRLPYLILKAKHRVKRQAKTSDQASGQVQYTADELLESVIGGKKQQTQAQKYFKVVDFCPQLSDRLHGVKRALSDSLVNRRSYLRRIGKLQV
ncbi:hypothetical protein OS493_032237 [Desmophyllum pertusum]|uniref:Uncharacterized protein n=1 Tax=Desmophyllum pertusum TaxID=174260 RepID=A0A9W9ZLA3_9CNID|nr:hypothetical protein OS493_032237 [Desmophyllum pertusum]